MSGIRRGFGNVLRFEGRDRMGDFWPYALALLGLMMIAGMAAMVPLMATTFVRMQRFAAEHPDQATVTQGPGQYSIQIQGIHPELIPDLSGFVAATIIGGALFVVLLAAAVVRRLHDSGRSGWWGTLPLPFLATGLILFPRMFGSISSGVEPDLRLFALLFVNNLVYLVALAGLIVRLVQRGTSGPNRYGAARTP